LKITRAANKFVLHFGRRERRMLTDLLKLYPCIPPAHHRLSKAQNLPDHESNQRLLDEALAEQRAENRKELSNLLTNPRRIKQIETGYRLSLSPAEVEWLLQILNDIRVGSWVLLGSPEPKMELAMLNQKTAPHFWAMQLAGDYEAQLIEALDGP
jgi:hypothetical protein